MLSSLKATQRLGLSFATIGFVTILLGVAVWASGSWQGRHLATLEQAGQEAVQQTNAMIAATGHAQVRASALAMAASNSAAQLGTMSVERAHRDLTTAIDGLQREVAGARTLDMAPSAAYDDVEQATSALVPTLERLSVLAVAAHAGEGMADVIDHYETQVTPAFASMDAALAAYEPAVRRAFAQRLQTARNAQRWSLILVLIGVGILLGSIGAVGASSVRHVGNRLSQLVSAARKVAAGEVLTPQRVTTDDEFGEVTEALNQLIDTLSVATVSKRYVESIVQHMADPLLVLDQDVCVQMANPALMELLGYEEHEMIGASIARIFAHSGRTRGAAIKGDIEKGLSGNVETSFRTKHGTTVPVAISCALIRLEGQLRGLVIVAKDITLQKEREKELIRARDEAERMVQLRDAFLANMSHEIRTPLTGILGSAQILAETVQGEHRNLARIIEDAGSRLLDTINSVLEMARIEAGEVQPDMEVLDFGEEADAVIEVLRPIANKKGLAISVRRLVDEPVAAQLDRGCLNRILNNLIGNALKFTQEGAVCVEVGADEDNAMITVRDTGIGISEEFLPQLFDDFKQESTGLRRSHEGTGLGLAITKKLVEMMGGTISVQSVKGVGSAFTARFDRAPVGAVAVSPRPPHAGDGQHMLASLSVDTPWEQEIRRDPEMMMTPPLPPEQRAARDVLLIEDNQQNAYMARFMLEGFSTDVAHSPEEAIDLVARHQYGVLLVDINLGTSVTGVDLLKSIRRVKGYERTPAIAVTAYALPGDRDRFIKEGFDEYVAKPYRKEALLSSITRMKEKASTPALEPSLDGVLQTFKEAVDAVTSEPNVAKARQRPTSEPAPVAVPAAAEKGEREPYPVASPDDFLPANFRPTPAGSGESASAPHAHPAAPAQRHAPRRPGDGPGRPPFTPGR